MITIFITVILMTTDASPESPLAHVLDPVAHESQGLDLGTTQCLIL